jgi:hypothetical protein
LNTQIFDDGSVLTYDNDGNVISAVSSDGQALAVPGPQGSGVVQQFATLFNYGARAAIDRFVRPTQAQAATAPGNAATKLSPDAQLKLVLLLALGAALAFKFLK